MIRLLLILTSLLGLKLNALEYSEYEAMRNVALSFLNDYSNPLYADPIFWGNFSIGYSNL